MGIKVFRYKDIKHNLLISYIFIPVYLIPVFLLPFLVSCSNDKVIDKDKFVKIYTDIIIVQDTIPLSKSAFDSVKQSILNKYGVASAQYDSTVRYYNQDVRRWESFFTKTTAYIDTLKNKKVK